MKTKFKSGDFVENIRTGEIEMVYSMDGNDWVFFIRSTGTLGVERTSNYRPISSKEIVIRDKQLKQ